MSDEAEYEFTFVVERSDDGGWSAVCPDLPGLLLAGDTQAEMLQDAREVVRDYLREMTAHGFEIGKPGEEAALSALIERRSNSARFVQATDEIIEQIDRDYRRSGTDA